jgi:hypothetical protein
MEANQETHGGVGLRPLDFRIVAMEATCLSYGGSFPKSDTNGGAPEERTVDGIRQ